MKWQYNEICQFLVVDIYHFQFSLIHPFKKMKHWKLDIIGSSVIGPECYIEKENIALAYIDQLPKFGKSMSYGSKEIFKYTPCLMYWYSPWSHRFGKLWDG